MIHSSFDVNNERDKNDLFEEILRKTKDPIVLYLHGNTGSRANGHRVDLYKILRRLGCHVIAFDYRGFADSSDESPTEKGCVNDALAMYQYIKNLTTTSPVFVYGHSLGTGISLHMASIVNKSNIDNPKGVILEAPFNNMRDEVIKHPFSWLFRNLPWFETTILKPIYENGFRFESDQRISEFRSPVMILHAENDRVIPYELGYKLYRTALETRGKSWGPAEFHRFEEKYGHKFIVRSKNFPSTIDQFIRRYKNETY
ncbi:CLUMA_CG011394, isoform A [Clunio marinus]|uniref:CLUMA_CG011394, isoform A n=1 Tax=Clunio marinus TaxID=568069 RepID=A0A1J1IHU3_9DIPT|nr:CLUMA_CG011394, isoform A [Clunio marinus]